MNDPINEIKFSDPDSILVIQVPRETNQLSSSYISGICKDMEGALPPGRKAYVIGSDVNLFEIRGIDVLALKLRGLISE